MKDCVIVIPAYKPSLKLIELIQALQVEWISKIVCVDDGSGSEFSEIFESIEKMDKTYVLKHSINMGKGRALKTAFNYVLNVFSDGDMIITVDADGQHTIDAVKRVYSDCCGYNCIILGKREFSNINQKDIPFRSRFGNILTKMVFNLLCNVNVTDTQTGLRAIPIENLPLFLLISGERYEYETNCLLYCKDYSLEIRETEIETIYENNNESSHFNPLRDSLRIYLIILKYLCSSIISVLVDYTVFFTLANFVENVFVLTYAGRICSSLVNFMVNKKIVFRTKGKGISQAIKYYLLVFLSGTFSAIAVFGFKMFVSGNLFWAKVIVETILFFFNFWVQKKFIFNVSR